MAVPFHHHLAHRDDVSECAMDDDEFFPFNNGQKRIGGDGAKIIPSEKERKEEIVIFCRIPPIFSKLFTPLVLTDDSRESDHCYHSQLTQQRPKRRSPSLLWHFPLSVQLERTWQCFSLPLRFALYPRTKLMAKYPVAIAADDDCIYLEIFGAPHNGYNGRFSREGRERKQKQGRSLLKQNLLSNLIPRSPPFSAAVKSLPLSLNAVHLLCCKRIRGHYTFLKGGM